MNKTRKVSFYRLGLTDNNSTNSTDLSNEEVESKFNSIYSQMQELSDGSKAKNLDVNKNTYVVQILDYSSHKAFMKIGQQNSANTVAIRDKHTLESEDVPMTESQLLELFTFCLIDFETCIVSYIGINGAPKISAIKGLFNDSLSELKITATLDSIMTEDILRTIIRKDIISKMSITVAVPSDEVLSQDMGLNPTDFDSLRDVKTRVATYKLVATKNKNIFSDSGRIAQMVEAIRNRFGDNLRNINVNARDNGEKSQTYDILQYNFTKTVVLGGNEDHNTIDADAFKLALEQTYITYRQELMRYVRR